MKYSMYRRWFCLLSYTFVLVLVVLGFPVLVVADGGSDNGESEIEVEIEILRTGDSASKVGDSRANATAFLLEAEYEINNMVFSFGYERWDYDWTNPESVPFTSGIAAAPWDTFNTLQFGFAYEHDINERWEFLYYIEAESSFEKETSKSGEYELGVDFTYTQSDAWAYTLNVNLEYLDAASEGTELGVDLEIAWNHHAKQGWSGEFEISSEFPETTLRYHFTKKFAVSGFYGENGTNTIRLSDSSPVEGMQGGYLEDEYNSLGIRLNYELGHESYLSFSLQQNFDRVLAFTDLTGLTEINYDFGDSIGFGIQYSLEF